MIFKETVFVYRRQTNGGEKERAVNRRPGGQSDVDDIPARVASQMWTTFLPGWQSDDDDIPAEKGGWEGGQQITGETFERSNKKSS